MEVSYLRRRVIPVDYLIYSNGEHYKITLIFRLDAVVINTIVRNWFRLVYND